MTRLIDPIHFFNERGQSVLSTAHLEAENAKLHQEIAELKRQKNALALRLRTIAGDTDESTSLNS
jgi:cell shape-determining protein MreC